MTTRPDFLNKYRLNWELLNVVAEGCSALDTQTFLMDFQTKDDVLKYLEGYGPDQANPVLKAELFGNFQEALQFIKTYFLKENNPKGVELSIPNTFFTITEASDLLLMIHDKKRSCEERLWAMTIAKVMHTIFHVDKDLRHNYFPVIQQQILDRYYKYLHRDDDDKLYLGIDPAQRIPLYSFTTKSKKTRDSIIIKLLHKPENVAEELFDRIGIRIVTFSILDTIKVIKFLQLKNIITPHNIKPSRSLNSLIDLKILKSSYYNLLKKCLRENLSEEQFHENLYQMVESTPSPSTENIRNEFSSKNYRTIQFTCRQLIKYKNPFMIEYSSLRNHAKHLIEINPENSLARKILDIDISSAVKDIRFFYPYEVQITDMKNHEVNTIGEASHEEYKNLQLVTAMMRLFKPLLKLKKQDCK